MLRNIGTASLCLVVCLSACASHDEGEGDTGEVGLNITAAPSDVRCVVLQATGGGRTVTKSLDVTPGQAIYSPVNGLPTGNVTIGALAYPSACSAVTANSAANWASDPVSQVITVTKGTTVPVSLVLRPNGVIQPTIDWQDDAAGGAGGAPTTSVGGMTNVGGGTVGGNTATGCNDVSNVTASVNQQYGYYSLPVVGTSKTYGFFSNWWNAFAGQTESLSGLSFTLTNQVGNGTGATPAGFPALFIGSYAGHDNSAGANLPRQVTAITSAPVILQTNAATLDSSNLAFTIEAWLSSTPTLSATASTPGSGGAYLDIWPIKPPARQPLGTMVSSTTIAGASWNVWYANNNPPTITYVSATSLTSLTVDLKPFLAHASTNNFGVTPSQYLTTVFGGIQVWSGGYGASVSKFCAQIN
jgi:hypothetical protein